MMHRMPELPPQRRVAASAKKTVDLHIRVTRLESELLQRLVSMHDPPTVSAYLRDLIGGEFDKPMPRPPGSK
jgi:hypothetical protein